MCFAIQVSGIILRPFYGRVRSPYIAVSIFLELPSSVYDLRATKSNRPANLPGQSVSFRQLPSPRPFKRSNSFLPSFNASRLRLFNRETLRFLSLLPFCPVTSYHNGTIAHPWNIYTRRELHACKPSQPRLYRIEKRIDANGRFLDGVGYRYVCRYVDVGQSLRSSDCLGNRY